MEDRTKPSEEMPKKTGKQRRQEKSDSVEKTGFYRFCYATFAWFIGLIFRIRVRGEENIPAEGGYLVCGNHVSATDPILIAYAMRRRQLRIMAKKELFSIPVFASLIRGLGAFPVDRKHNDVGAIRHAVEVVKKGRCLCIFPQGHRYPGVDPRTTKVKNGAALIAVRSGGGVLPVFIMRKNNRHKLFSPATVIFGEPFSLESLGIDPQENGAYARISAAIFDRICTIGEQAGADTGEEGQAKS